MAGKQRPIVLACVSDVHAGGSDDAAIESGRYASVFGDVDDFAGCPSLTVAKDDAGLLGLADEMRDDLRQQGSQVVPRVDGKRVLHSSVAVARLLSDHGTHTAHFTAPVQQPDIGICDGQRDIHASAATRGVEREASLAIDEPSEIARFGRRQRNRWHGALLNVPVSDQCAPQPRCRRASAGTEYVLTSVPLILSDLRCCAPERAVALVASELADFSHSHRTGCDCI